MLRHLRQIIFMARLVWHESDLRGIDISIRQLEAERAARVQRIAALHRGRITGVDL